MPIGVTLETESGKGFGVEEFALPGTGESVPGGVDSIIYYNGIVLNDRSVIDKYRITDIDGLGDADIRDSRENNPSNHGETAFNAYYGGRTITLTGRIEAHNLTKLRDMQQALKTAFSPLEEKQLYFSIANSKFDHYIMCRKSAPIAMGETQKGYSFYRDFMITLRASDPRFLGQNQQTVTMYPNNVPNPSFETNTTGWEKVATSWTTSAFERSGSYADHGSWGAKLTGTKDATVTERKLIARTSTGTSGMPVVEKTQYTLQMAVKVEDASSLGFKCNVAWYKAAGTLISTTESEASTGTGVRTVRTTVESPSEAAFASVQISANSNTVSDTVDIRFDSVWFVRGNPSIVGYGSVPNVGSFTSLPVIRAHGKLDSLTLTNDSNGQTLVLVSGTTINDGEYFLFDIGNRTLENSLGENKFGKLDATSDWLELKESTSNQLRLSIEDTATTVNSRIEISYRNSWL